MPRFHIFTMLWGDHYIDLFKNACFRSMNWPLNKAALQGVEWHVYTAQDHVETITKLFEGSGFNLKLAVIPNAMRVAGCGTVPTAQCDSGVILLNGLREEIRHSIQNKSRVLLAPPDTIFGDGTIPNLLNLGLDAGTCVAVAHSRVLPSILEEIDVLGATRGAISNAQLVTMAFNHAHDSWKYSEIGAAKNSSYIGGVAWRRLNPGLYSVTHRLPTCYLCDFSVGDFNWWWGMVSFGAFDHTWPGEMLVRQERIRYAGSSDACFIVEVTEWDKNVPPVMPNNDQMPRNDTYSGDRLHHCVNRLFNVILRGE